MHTSAWEPAAASEQELCTVGAYCVRMAPRGQHFCWNYCELVNMQRSYDLRPLTLDPALTWFILVHMKSARFTACGNAGGEVVESLVVLHRPEDLAEFSKAEFVIKDCVNAGANVPEQAGAHAASGAPVVFSAATGLTLKKGTHDLNGALHV